MTRVQKQTNGFLYGGVAAIFVTSIVLALTFGAPVWATWTQNPAPVGFEGATIYDTVLIAKDPVYEPLGIPYIGWAVGKLNESGGAVIFKYNGTSWTRVFSDPGMAPLKAVDARWSGTYPEIIAVGDFTLNDTTKITRDYNTIVFGQNDVFSIQTYQNTLAEPQTCRPSLTPGCKSWIGSSADPVGLTGVAFTDDSIIQRYDGGSVCTNPDLKSSVGFYAVGQRGALLVGQRCITEVDDTESFKMFVVTDERDPTYGYFKTLFSSAAIPVVTKDYTALTKTKKNVYFFAAQQEDAGGPKPRLFKFTTTTEALGLREVAITGSALDGKAISHISTVQKAGEAITSTGSPWQLFLSTTSGAPPSPNPDVVYAEVSGDAVTPLTTSVMRTYATGGTPISDAAVSVTYRGGELVVNGDFPGIRETNAVSPDGWQMSGSMSNFDSATRPMVSVVDNPTPGIGASGKVLHLTTELLVSNDAALRFYTNETLSLEASATKHAVYGIEAPMDWDADALLSANTTNGKGFRIAGFLQTTDTAGNTPGLPGYDFRLTYDTTAKARMYLGENLSSSGADFTTPMVNGWFSGTGTATGTKDFTSTAGAEILDSVTMGQAGGGLKRAGSYYPFVLEYYSSTTSSGRRLKVEWKPKGAAESEYRVVDWELQVGNNQLKRSHIHQAFAAQVLEQTRGRKGPVYRVSGMYRVAKAPDAFFSLAKLDPRRPLRGWGGVALRCDGGNGFTDCGFKWDMFVDPKVESDTLTTNAAAGGWRSFDFLMTKTTSDTNLGLSIVPLTEYGSSIWIDTISVTPYQEDALAQAPQYTVYAVSPDGSIFEGDTEDLSVLNLEKKQTSTEALNTISVIAPNKGVAAGANGMLLDLIPGFVRGWGWVGATTAAASNDALGWISFSCADLGLCNEHQLTYGVDVLDALPPPSDTKHPFSGAAWFGTKDSNQVRELTGSQVYRDGYCSGDSSYICSHTSDPDEFCSDRGLGACNEGETRCSTAISFKSTCSVSCASHPFGCTSVGWLSFERNTDPLLSAGVPPAAPYNTAGSSLQYTATLDDNTSQVQGWARFLSLKEEGVCDHDGVTVCTANADCPAGVSCVASETTQTDGGWVKLQGPPVTIAGPLTGCEACELTGSAIACDICTEDLSTGTIAFCTANTSCTGRCKDDPSLTCDGSGSTCPGEDCLSFGACSVTTSITCVDNSQCPPSETCDNRSYECESPSPPPGPPTSCYQWGTALNDQNGNFVGWAWSEDVGWIDMSRVRLGNQAWFQTLQGNIFSGDDVGDATNQNPVGSCNATYRINAVGRLVNVCSTAQTAFPSSPFQVEGSENLISDSSGLITIFGAIDVPGIIGDQDGDYQPDDTMGRYGSIVDLNDPARLSEFTTALDGSGLVLNRNIYFYQGDLTLNGGTIKNAPSGQSGNGTLIVNGDLTIDGNLTYQQTPVNNLDQLASLGVIVLGDMDISSAVEQLVGSYYLPGNPLFGEAGDTILHAGGTATIEGGQTALRQFVQQGLLIAKTFVFNRRFGGPLTAPEPAERIIYDGRVVANPPPGFTTVRNALPTVRQIVP